MTTKTATATTGQRLPKKLVDFLFVQKKFSRPGFSKLLGTDPETLINRDSKAEVFIHEPRPKQYDHCFRIQIPSSACLPIPSAIKNSNQKSTVVGKNNKQSSNGRYLPLTGILTVIDDLTTYSLVDIDESSRPGVSTSLSATLTPYGLMNLPKPGDHLDVNVKVIKIGKRMGFTEASLTCSKTNAVVATGRHTKFLEVGSRLQKIALSPFILPILSWYSSKKNRSLLQQGGKGPSSNPTLRNDDGTSEMENLMEFELNDSGETGKIYIKKGHLNPLGSFHGGAMAMSMECFATIPFSESRWEFNQFRLQSISVNYISTSKSEISFARDVTSFSNDSTMMIDVNATNGSGQTVANGVLHYMNISSDEK